MTYLEFLKLLKSYAEQPFADFQQRLIFTKREILGVRTPILRQIAKRYMSNLDEILSFPNEYYEVVFIKLTQVSQLPYNQFVARLDECVSWMDNWALCDSFKAKCIRSHKSEFLPILKTMFQRGGEYEQRYPLVVLLSEYVEKDYLAEIEQFIMVANTGHYYVYMAVAWLMAEILVKEYECGVHLLKRRIIDVKTCNKAIQKATESLRLTKQQKDFLRSLKIENYNE